jgi:hypothetical protein
VTLLPTVGAWIDAGSGVLLLALGLWVTTRRPRRRLNLLLAMFSATMGAGFLASQLVSLDDPARAPLELAAVPLLLAASGGVAALALRFPAPVGRAEARYVVGAGLAALATAALSVVVYSVDPVGPADAVIGGVLRSALWFALLLFALRAAGFASNSAARSQLRLLTLALLPFTALTAGWNLGDVAVDPQGLAVDTANVLRSALVPAVLWMLWIRIAAHSVGREAAAARNLALLALAVPALAVALTPLLGSGSGSRDSGLNGITRTLAVAVLAYAILRHQLLGIDLKVKWTIKQSTLAGVFIGVFFVVSEGAQQVFSQSLGPVIGIVAAGALLFALTPLQHAAERVASAAVPGARPVGQLSVEDRTRLYRDAASQAWADGSLSRDEAAMLRSMQRGLGLSDAEAQAIEREVEGARA